MRTGHRKTFEEILREEAPHNAGKLEAKARNASWIAKIRPEHSTELYAIKHEALRQLFRIPAHAPLIRDAWATGQGFLLSVGLRRTGSLLHVPFSELNAKTRQTHGMWISRRARGQLWHQPLRVQPRAPQTAVGEAVRSDR
jgi:hypothetical protein